tara:strand:+ start:821 stop:1096 length:276 start_codon:yes stop_codon:yes gene_type:complete
MAMITQVNGKALNTMDQTYQTGQKPVPAGLSSIDGAQSSISGLAGDVSAAQGTVGGVNPASGATVGTNPGTGLGSSTNPMDPSEIIINNQT